MKQLRRSMLFVPASNPSMLVNAPVYKPDCIIFDLEDSIALNEKDSSRDLLCEALKTVDYSGIEIFARVNPLYTPFGEKDVRELVKAGLRNVRLPMCETAKNVEELDSLLADLENELGLENGMVKIMCSIETPKGVINAEHIALASKRVVAISMGAEDYTRLLGAERTREGTELFYARSKIVVAAAAAEIDAIDTVYSNIDDQEGFLREVETARTLGFAGKSCLHPSQVKTVHQVFTPSMKEVEKSMRIINAIEEANKKGLGVVSVDGKMVDVPVVAKAQRVVALAKGAGII